MKRRKKVVFVTLIIISLACSVIFLLYELNNSNNEMTTKDSEISDLQNEIKWSERSLTDVRDELREKNDLIDLLNDQIQDLEEEIDDLKYELNPGYISDFNSAEEFLGIRKTTLPTVD